MSTLEIESGVCLRDLNRVLKSSSSFYNMFIMVNIISSNIRGAAAKCVPLLLKDLICRHHVNCIALFETRASSSWVPAIAKIVGFDKYFIVEADGFSGGIWLLWSSQ